MYKQTNMATGGVFQLITNDGKQDRMLMATQMLRNRLEAIRAKRRADPSIQDETPTLLDIERTHVLFTNAHFKPFVALGYEYNKVNTGAGTVQLGSSIQFSIPQFGDSKKGSQQEAAQVVGNNTIWGKQCNVTQRYNLLVLCH